MSAVSATPIQSQPQQSIKPGQVLITGRLTAFKRAGQLFEHLIVIPAPDPYSSPATVSVLGKSRLGDQEQDVRVLCRVGGYRRSFNSTDRETGEVRKVQTADNKLFVVED